MGAVACSPDQDPQDQARGTLGDLLYADKAKKKKLVPEEDWVGLVHSIGAGEQHALHALYERTHRLVFTLIARITNNRETAEELTLDVSRRVATSIDVRCCGRRIGRRMDHEPGAIPSD